MGNNIAFTLIPNEEGKFEAYSSDYDVIICCKSKEDQDKAIKKIKKGQASLQAWDEVKAEIQKEHEKHTNINVNFGLGLALGLIDRHLAELQQQED